MEPEVIDKIISLSVWVVGGLATAVVALAVYIVKIQGKLNNISKETTSVITRNTVALESNTKSHDRIYEYFTNGKKK